MRICVYIYLYMHMYVYTYLYLKDIQMYMCPHALPDKSPLCIFEQSQICKYLKGLGVPPGDCFSCPGRRSRGSSRGVREVPGRL